MDPENQVVRLCASGMEAEAQGQIHTAAALFAQAWEIRSNDYEGCVAAHYVARHQKTQTASHEWNAEALRRADAAHDDRVKPLYPSLYLNMGYSCEVIGKVIEAQHFYTMAAHSLGNLDPGPYADMVGRGVSRAMARLRVVDALGSVDPRQSMEGNDASSCEAP